MCELVHMSIICWLLQFCVTLSTVAHLASLHPAVLCGLCGELIPSQSNYYVCVITGVQSAWVDFSDLVHCVRVLISE